MSRAASSSSAYAGALVALFAVTGSIAACSIAELPPPPPAAGALETKSAECTSAQQKLEKQDLKDLKPCACAAGGKAHCVAKAKMPASFAGQLEACDGEQGACVPDTILETAEPPPSCKTSGAEGRCVSLCIPKVAEYVDGLTRGDGNTCPEDERCVPCLTPSGKSSGICEIGAPPPASCTADGGGATTPGSDDGPTNIACPYTGPEQVVTNWAVCAPGGRCVKEESIDKLLTDPKKRDELKARLERCETGLCVPEEYIKKYGQHKPAACSSFAGIEGRCFSTVFKDVKAQKDLLQRDTCGESDRCIPCFNPADGTPTGACSTVSCDQPATTTPPALKDCCRVDGETRGKCVRRTDVPTQFQSRLSEHECDDGTELCVPSENLDLKAKTTSCTPSGAAGGGKGVCVSDCIEFRLLEGIFLGQSNCRDDQTCVPCIDPKTKQPTGAPGCN